MLVGIITALFNGRIVHTVTKVLVVIWYHFLSNGLSCLTLFSLIKKKKTFSGMTDFSVAVEHISNMICNKH